jgi:hypothetical protein
MGIVMTANLKVLKSEAPSTRTGGTILESVDALLDKLRNEAKVI